MAPPKPNFKSRFKSLLPSRHRSGTDHRSSASAPDPGPSSHALGQNEPSTTERPTSANTPTGFLQDHLSMVATQAEPPIATPALAVAEQTDAEHTPTSEEATRTSLWARAYEKLKEDQAEDVTRYNDILSKEISSRGLQPDQETTLIQVNTQGGTQPDVDRDQLRDIIKRCEDQAKDKQKKRTIFGHEFDPRGQAKTAVDFVMKCNDLISKAVAVSPEAALAWAGISIFLPLVANPKIASEEASDGLAYVAARSTWYAQLEPHVWPPELKQPELEEEFRAEIVQLYYLLIEFQIKIVIRHHDRQITRTMKDTIRSDDWKGMISKIKKQEETVKTDSDTIYTTAGHKLLTDALDEAVEQSSILYRQVQILQDQLEVGREQLNVGKQILDASQETNHILREVDLPTVQEACYDSHEFASRDKCWPGTRQQVVDKIIEWTTGDAEKPILWLNGPLGTGKSTIALTVTEKVLSEDRLLATFFFFRRGGEDRNKITRLFPTLASQMAHTLPSFKEALHRSLGGLSKIDIEKKSVKAQFDLLISTPLNSMSAVPSKSSRTVLVIDALDECDDLTRIDTERGGSILNNILGLFSKLCTVRDIPFRILLTSRSDPYIVDAMEEQNLVQPLKLHHRDLVDDTKQDIRTFLSEKLASIRNIKRLAADWPSAKDKEELIKKACDPEPLFIYAATLILFIEGKRRSAKPKLQLEKWLRSGESTSPFGPVYEPVINQALGDPEDWDNDSEAHDRLLLFLGTLCLLSHPLPQEAIATLLGYDSDEVGQWITSLHAVLDIAGPESNVQLRHKSLSDFLFGSQSADYHVDEAKTHTHIAHKCLDRMQAGLRRNICDLEGLDVETKDIANTIVSSRISVDLKYSCEHWVHHLVCGDRRPVEKVWDFIKRHFLHWLEAMSLLALVPQAMHAIAALLQHLQDQNLSLSVLVEFVADAMIALSGRSHLFQTHPLQVYSSFSIFLPLDNLVRAMYWESRLPFSCDIQGIARTSDTHQRVLGHDDTILAVAFSPCSQLIAVATVANQISIWHAMSGVPRCTLNAKASSGFTGSLRIIQFSPKSDFMVAPLRHGGVWLWNLMSDVDNGVFLECNARSLPRRVVFIDDTHFRMAFDNSMTCTWSVDCRSVTAAKVFHPLADSQDDQNSREGLEYTELSPDGRILATTTVTNNWAVHLWDVASERSLHTVHEPAGKHRLTDRPKLSFSPDGTILATWSRGIVYRNIWLWNTSDGRISRILRCEGTMNVREPVFSPDSRTLATTDGFGGVQLWHISSGVSRSLLMDRSDEKELKLLKWTPDGRWLTVVFRSGRMVLCDVETGECSQLLQVPGIYLVYFSLWFPSFSPDGQTLASVRGSDLQLFNVQTLLHPTKQESPREPHAGEDIKLACSSDGQILASASTQDSSIVLWSVVDWRVRKRIQLPRESSRVAALAISPDGKRIATASRQLEGFRGYQFHIWWTATGKKAHSIKADNLGDVLALYFSPEGYITAMAKSSTDYNSSHLLWFWDPTTWIGRGVRTMILFPQIPRVARAAFSRSGRVLALGCWSWPWHDFGIGKENDYHLLHAETGDCLQSGTLYRERLHSFDMQCGLRVNTSQGYLCIPHDSPAGKILANHDCLCKHHEDNSQLGWSVNEHWLQHEGRRCILLPPDYHETALLAHGSTLFVGCDNGRVLRVSSIGSNDQNDD